MSGSNCCFLICIQVSQEAGKGVCFSHLFKNLPQFVVIHTIKSFGVVNETETDVFLELSCFLYDPMDVGNLISGSSAFSKSNLNIWNCWSLAWRILSITLLVCEMSTIAWQFKHSLAFPFFGIGMKTDLFQSHGHCCVFQICWYIEWSILIVSSSRIWNNSARIPSLPLVCSDAS